MQERKAGGLSREQLLQALEEKAAAYTPEWRMDLEHPDMGTAVALVFADMFADTARQFQRTAEKNQRAFFNELDAKLLPAEPARGYVTFSLSTDAYGGTEVPAGFGLSAEGEARIPFETADAVYVCPVRLDAIVSVEAENDRISRIYHRGESNEEPAPFELFSGKGDNLQSRQFFACFDEVLQIKGAAVLRLELVPWRFWEAGENGLAWLADSEEARFEYFDGEHFTGFEKQRFESGSILLEKGAGQPPFVSRQWEGSDGYWIRCRLLKKYNRPDLKIEDVKLSVQASHLPPDAVQNEEGELNLWEFLPFGQRPTLFAEAYIAADEVLSKRNARITMQMKVDFVKIPQEYVPGEAERDWKLLMKRSDFKTNPEADITIEEVIWEYFNGVGWSRLFPSNQYQDIFGQAQKAMGRRLSIEFTCPEDASPILCNSLEARYLRVRVLKMANLLQPKGSFITPVLSGVNFSYQYMEKKPRPKYLYSLNNMKWKDYPGKYLGLRPDPLPLFQKLEAEGLELYLGFALPFWHGPIRILFATAESMQARLPRLEMEYLSETGWKGLSAVDETDSMQRTGLVTFMAQGDYKKERLWEYEGFWIRLRDREAQYQRRSAANPLPRIMGIYPNSVRVLAVSTKPEEYFSIEEKEENKVCRLLETQIYDLKVWVDENSRLSGREKQRLSMKLKTECEYDRNGELSRYWVLWEEREDFYSSGPADRHYIVDRNEGRVMFSNGRQGAIPPGGTDTIRIWYRCTSGKEANVDAGQVRQMDRSLGFITQVNNTEIIGGGCSQETVEGAIRRSAKGLRHGSRAVTAGDFEALALEASRNVLKVKCFSGCGADGRREPGAVTLVLLQRDFLHGRKHFDSIRASVEDYLKPRLPGNMAVLGKLHVVGPEFLRICCRVSLTIRDYNQVFEVQKQVRARIDSFLHPVTGNYHGRGWDIGQIPNGTQVTNAIREIPGILYIQEVWMSAYKDSRQGPVEVDLKSGAVGNYALPLSGVHDIQIGVDQ